MYAFDTAGNNSHDRVHFRPMLRLAIAFCACLVSLLCAVPPAVADERQVIGWIEPVEVSSENLSMLAKVDTGADYSSVHAIDLRISQQDGGDWASFTLRNRHGEERTLRREVVRFAKIKKKDGGHQRRPVVLLRLCVGRVARTAAVNLAERGHFRYPLLLGRDYLGGHFLVDPGRQQLSTPACAVDGGADDPRAR